MVVFLKKYDYLLRLSLLLPEDFDLPLLPEFPDAREPPLLLLPDIFAPDEDDCLEERFATIPRSDCGFGFDLVVTLFVDRLFEPILCPDCGFVVDLFVSTFVDRRAVKSFCLD